MKKLGSEIFSKEVIANNISYSLCEDNLNENYLYLTLKYVNIFKNVHIHKSAFIILAKEYLKFKEEEIE